MSFQLVRVKVSRASVTRSFVVASLMFLSTSDGIVTFFAYSALANGDRFAVAGSQKEAVHALKKSERYVDCIACSYPSRCGKIDTHAL